MSDEEESLLVEDKNRVNFLYNSFFLFRSDFEFEFKAILVCTDF